MSRIPERHDKDSRNDTLPFSKEEKKKNKEIEDNFDEILDKLLDNPDFKKLSLWPGEKPEHLVLQDGFFPGYLDQNLRILFIGRDAFGLRNHDYTISMWGKLHNDKKRFYKTILSIAYCLAPGDYPRNSAGERTGPSPSSVVDTIYDRVQPKDKKKGSAFGHTFSFALVNASKIDHHDYDPKNGKTKDWKYHPKDAGLFINSVGPELIKEQVDIIDPEIIIGANLYKAKLGGKKNKGKNFVENVYNCDNKKEFNSFIAFDYHSLARNEPIIFIDSKKHFKDFRNSGDYDDVGEFIEEIIKFLEAKGMWPFKRKKSIP